MAVTRALADAIQWAVGIGEATLDTFVIAGVADIASVAMDV